MRANAIILSITLSISALAARGAWANPSKHPVTDLGATYLIQDKLDKAYKIKQWDVKLNRFNSTWTASHGRFTVTGSIDLNSRAVTTNRDLKRVTLNPRPGAIVGFTSWRPSYDVRAKFISAGQRIGDSRAVQFARMFPGRAVRAAVTGAYMAGALAQATWQAARAIPADFVFRMRAGASISLENAAARVSPVRSRR